MTKRSIKLLLISLATITSCNLLEFSPYETNTNDLSSNINNTNINLLLDKNPTNDTIRFAFVCDNHYYYDELEKVVKDINANKALDFVLHGGDVTDCGTSKEFEWFYDIMADLTIPYITIPGNHDLLGTGEYIFENVFGDLNFAFTYNRTKFLCLNYNPNESSALPDTNLILSELHDSTDLNYDQVVIATHNFEWEDHPLIYDYFEDSRDLLFLIQGHSHHFDSDTIQTLQTERITGRAASKEYLTFEISPSHYQYTRHTIY